MTTLVPQTLSTGVPAAPSYTAVTAADKFAANPSGTYLLHYKNGATVGTAAFYVVNQVVTLPPSVATPALPTGATHWDDLPIVTSLGANAERDVFLDASIIAQYIDGTGFVNLVHNGTLTTITIALYGPF
jgi:hypothetical protein